jgi:methyl-accepting chemotaxis protein
MAGRKVSGADSGASRDARAVGVMFEQIQSQMNVVLEAVTSGLTRLENKIDGVEARLSERISVLEQVVRQNSLDIRKNSEDIRKNSEDIRKNSEDIRKNSDEIRELREEVARLRHDFEHRAELTRIADLEGRVAAIERRLGV